MGGRNAQENKECLDSDALPEAAIVGTGNGWQGITFHTNTKNTPSGQPEGYTWHMKKTFSDKVRDIVRKIPKSKTMTYKEVASKAGNPMAARAVGAVMRSNYDPSIPCHRVVASDGKMRGYKCGARIR
jgi:methylated-DNA-[protein]-cysteine S-methyltransferase